MGTVSCFPLAMCGKGGPAETGESKPERGVFSSPLPSPALPFPDLTCTFFLSLPAAAAEEHLCSFSFVVVVYHH
jgi:hypothetical protein